MEDVSAFIGLLLPLVIAAALFGLIVVGARRRPARLAGPLRGKVSLLGNLAFERKGLPLSLGAVSGNRGSYAVLTAFVDVDGPWYFGVEGADAFAPFGRIPGPLREVVVGERHLFVSAGDPAVEARLVAALTALDPRVLDVLLPERFGSVSAGQVRHVPEGLRDELRCLVMDRAVWDDPAIVTARADALAALVGALRTRPVAVPRPRATLQ